MKKERILNREIAQNDQFKFTAFVSEEIKEFEVVNVRKNFPPIQNVNVTVIGKNLKTGKESIFNLENLIGVGAVYIN